jgi:hypothetical protein
MGKINNNNDKNNGSKFRFIAYFSITYEEEDINNKWYKTGTHFNFIKLDDIMALNNDNDNFDIKINNNNNINNLEQDLPYGTQYLNFIFDYFVKEFDWYKDDIKNIDIIKLYEKEEEKNDKLIINKDNIWQETYYKGMFDIEIEFRQSYDYYNGGVEDDSEVINFDCIMSRECDEWEHKFIEEGE